MKRAPCLRGPATLLAAWRRWLQAAALAWLGWALLGPARADPCPPPAAAPSPAQVQAELRAARDRGLLWRFERDGRVGWLYGTVHVGRLAWAFPGPTVGAALRAADTLALELDLSDPGFAPQLADAAAWLRQREAAWGLPEALRLRLSALAGTACVNAAALAGQPLLLQALALSVLSARRDDLDPAYSQEATLAGFARATGKAVVSMETPLAQFEALLPTGATDAEQVLNDTLDRLADGRARAQMVRLAGLWERGDLAELGRFERWCDCVPGAADHERLRRANDARNPALAERIAALHGQGRQVFAAVGALHMTGPQALPGLLAERGFQVQRVVFP